MSYQVLARKWRPQNFAQLVAQNHVKQALINALDNQRLHHAYLFTGTRGVGKTTIARIFAKSLNCDLGISSQPCSTCSTCMDIEAGRYIDLLEIDAASRTKVEDTREILDNVQYAPSRGRYKVYLIDEVHMLSKHSFNALLKTLEEPPEHVKFLLATTDPQKLPITILSRCLQFNLSALTQNEISEQLNFILNKESLNFELDALALIAKSADGSMRDALSLTDQAIAQTNGDISVLQVKKMLGLMDRSWSHKLIVAILAQDGEELLTVVEILSLQNPNYQAVLDDLLSLTHLLLLTHLVPNAAKLSRHNEEFVTVLSKQVTVEQIQIYYQLLLNGKKDLTWAPDLRLGFEMILLRLLAFEPVVYNAAIDKPHSTIGHEVDKTGVANLRQMLNKPEQNKKSEFNQPDIETSVSQVEHDLQQQMSAVIEEADKLTPAHDTAARNEPIANVELTPAVIQEKSELNESNQSDNNGDKIDNLPIAEHINTAMSGAQSAIAKILANRNISGRGQMFTSEGSIKETQQSQNQFQQENEIAGDPEHPIKKIEPLRGVVTDKAPVIEQDPMIGARKKNLHPRIDTQQTDLAPELVEQISQVPAQDILPEEIIEIPEGFVSPLSDVKYAYQQDQWAELIHKMQLGGRIRQFALHGIWHQNAENVYLKIDATQEHLDSQAMREQLQHSLCEALQQNIKLNIEFMNNVANTPFLLQQKLDADRLKHAIEVIQQDPIVLGFIQRFNAEISEKSIIAN